MYARIYPPDPRTGHKCHRYVLRGFKFEAAKGWYKLTDAQAEELKACFENPSAPVLVPVFQIATEEEAKKISLAEYEAANPERKIQEAIAGAQTVPEASAEEVEKDAGTKVKPSLRVGPVPKASKEQPFA